MLPETQETPCYPPITPVSTNIPVKDAQKDKQAYTCKSSDEYHCDLAFPQSDRPIIDKGCLPATGVKSSSSPSKMPIKKTNTKCKTSVKKGKKEKASIDKPVITSRGKPKKYVCKQCDYISPTKLSFWTHARVHMKPERILACPQCPFVTQYKHHFLFHVLNHINSKPFKCHLCNYSSVSKNMLESHFKSHSDVRNYRCFECPYAAKYFHQLKLHLNKSEHKKGFMLNDDGTLDPQNVITPHGTARVKTSKKKTKSVQKEMPSLQQLATLLNNNFPTMMPFQDNPLNILPNTAPMPFYSYSQLYAGYNAFAFPTNFVSNQVVPEVCGKQTEYYEQNEPIDYSQKSASSASPSYEEMEEDSNDAESPLDLSDISSEPLDLSISKVPKTFNNDYNDKYAERDNSTSDGEMLQQIQRLRIDFKNVQKMFLP